MVLPRRRSRYVEHANDRLTLALLYPTLKRIVDCHVRGTRFGIHVDERDGLLVQGAEGVQLTWMDAKVDGWVVTPRRGKAVEINALWFNALRLMERWAVDHGDEASVYRQRADQAQRSFNERFWFADGGYLFDVVDAEGGGNDPKCRPNQMFAISLPHPGAGARALGAGDAHRPRSAADAGRPAVARARRSDYKAQYFGDLRTRDAAYHQGTVWGWLVGPFIDAWLKVYPDDVDAARAARSRASSLTWMRRASDRSARCSTPNRRSRRAAASRRRGAWRRSCARGSNWIWSG